MKKEKEQLQEEFKGYEYHTSSGTKPIIDEETHKARQRSVYMCKVLLLRMVADLSRYLSEHYTGYLKTDMIKRAIKAYQEAEAAACFLNQADQVVLRLAMSQAAFYYEVMNDHKKAC